MGCPPYATLFKMTETLQLCVFKQEYNLLCLTPLSAIFHLYHGDQCQWWNEKPEYPERTTDHGQATGKHYHLRLRVECTLFVIYKTGRQACMSCQVIQLPNSLSQPGPQNKIEDDKTLYHVNLVLVYENEHDTILE